MKALIVNSHTIQTKVLEKLLKTMGFYVNTANSSKRALKRLGQDKADIVLISHYLPDFSSFDFLKKAKELKLLENTKVLLMSSSVKDEIPIIAIANGADDFISEPIHVGELALKLTALTGKKITSPVLQELQTEIDEIYADESTSQLDYSRLWMNKTKNSGQGSTYASTLFIRFTNVTQLTASVPIELLSEGLNELFIEISKIVYRSRGSVHYIRGGSILTTFGAPLAYDNDTLDAALCAFRIQKFMEEYSVSQKKYLPEPIGISMGISTGRLTTTYVYSMKRTSSTVLGEPIEKANGLAHLAKQYKAKIFADSETREVIGNYAKFNEIDFSDFSCLGNIYHLNHVYELESIDEKSILELPNIEHQPGSKSNLDEEEYDKL